ncbi:unnamed protein product [Ixodes persulcatus]
MDIAQAFPFNHPSCAFSPFLPSYFPFALSTVLLHLLTIPLTCVGHAARPPTGFWTPRRSLVAIGTLRSEVPAAVSGTIVPVPARAHAAHRTEHIATWTALTLDGSAVGWWSRLAWDDQPQVPMGTPAGQVPEPFRRLTITDRHPTEPRAHYAPEERALLCEVCGVPEIHWPTHRAGLLHRERARAARGVGAQQAPAAYVPQDADLGRG